MGYVDHLPLEDRSVWAKERQEIFNQSNGSSCKHMSMFASLILLKDFAEISPVSSSPGRFELIQLRASFLDFQVRESEIPC